MLMERLHGAELGYNWGKGADKIMATRQRQVFCPLELLTQRLCPFPLLSMRGMGEVAAGVIWESVQQVSIISPMYVHWEKVENCSYKKCSCLVTIYNREVFAVSQSVFIYVTSFIPPNNPALFTEGYNPQ